jgi:hypothetical protein
MNRVRLIMLALVVVLAMSAVAASAASAFTEFTSKGGPHFTAAEGAKLKTKQEGNQTLEAKAGKVTVATICTGVEGEGTVEGGHTLIKGTPKYKGCTVGGLATTVTNACTFTFNAAGFVNLGGKNCATIEVTATKCKMTIVGEQEKLKTVTYKNKEANLVTEGKVGEVKFTSANGKACGFETEVVEGTATYNGSSLTEGTNVIAEDLATKQKGNQTLEAKAGKVTVATICTEVSGLGTVNATKVEIKGTPEYKGCTVGGLAAKVTNTCTFTFSIKEFVNLGGKNCATIEVTATKCKMTILGEQKELKTVTYKNQEANLVTEGKVGEVKFESANGKACGFETEAVAGTATYSGSSLTEGVNVK